jgi:hypothetical protein
LVVITVLERHKDVILHAKELPWGNLQDSDGVLSLFCGVLAGHYLTDSDEREGQPATLHDQRLRLLLNLQGSTHDVVSNHLTEELPQGLSWQALHLELSVDVHAVTHVFNPRRQDDLANGILLWHRDVEHPKIEWFPDIVQK